MDNLWWWFWLVVVIISGLTIPGLWMMLKDTIKEYKRDKNESNTKR